MRGREDNSTSWIMLRYNSKILESLDREVQDSYAIVMQAVDKGTPPLTGQATLHVMITDTNDQSPYFTPPVPEGEIDEDTSSNIPVQFLNLGMLTYDDDEPPNQVKNYHQTY